MYSSAKKFKYTFTLTYHKKAIQYTEDRPSKVNGSFGIGKRTTLTELMLVRLIFSICVYNTRSVKLNFLSQKTNAQINL